MDPLAVASVGQVYSACLVDGIKVVVKVWWLGLQKQVTIDLEKLAGLAELVEKHLPALISTRSRTLLAEFSRSLLSELNFS